MSQCHQENVSKRLIPLKEINYFSFSLFFPSTIKVPPTYSQAAKKSGESDAIVVPAEPSSSRGHGIKGTLCPYAVKGMCRYGEKCLYMHGEQCDLCGEACLQPFNGDQRKEHREVGKPTKQVNKKLQSNLCVVTRTMAFVSS